MVRHIGSDVLPSQLPLLFFAIKMLNKKLKDYESHYVMLIFKFKSYGNKGKSYGKSTDGAFLSLRDKIHCQLSTSSWKQKQSNKFPKTYFHCLPIFSIFLTLKNRVMEINNSS